MIIIALPIIGWASYTFLATTSVILFILYSTSNFSVSLPMQRRQRRRSWVGCLWSFRLEQSRASSRAAHSSPSLVSVLSLAPFPLPIQGLWRKRLAGALLPVLVCRLARPICHLGEFPQCFRAISYRRRSSGLLRRKYLGDMVTT